MARLSSLFARLYIQSAPSAAGLPVTAATKAAPCAITVTGTAPDAGDLVVPQGTGYVSLDGIPFVVASVAGQAVTLAGSDTTRETATVPASGATLESPTTVELCRSTINVNEPEAPTIDVTTLCDPAHRIVPGLPAVGTWTANGFWDSDDAGIDLARSYMRQGTFIAMQAVWSDGSGYAWRGLVSMCDVTSGVNAAVVLNLSGKIDGSVNKFDAGTVPVARRNVDGAPPVQAAA